MLLSEQTTFIILISVILLGCGFLLLLKYLEYRFLKKSSLHKIDRMSGVTFEKYLSVLFREQGYTVVVTPDRADFGADLIVEKAGTKTAIQAKRYQHSVGVHAIQEVVAAKYHYHCQKAMVITNSSFTAAAAKLAFTTDVTLIDRNKLEKWVRNLTQK